MFLVKKGGVTIVARGDVLGFLATSSFLQFLMGTILPCCYGNTPQQTAQRLCKIFVLPKKCIYCCYL